MVGGKTSQILDQAFVALKDSKDENKELREMIRTMAESHKALVIRNQAMEEKNEGLILSQQQVSTQATTTFPTSNDGEPINTQEAATRSTSQEEVNHAEAVAVHKVKLEKVKENSAARLKCKLHKENEIHALKRGMEVSLRSPNSLELVASATVSNVDDKETSPDYVEVLVNYVMKKSTMLPRAQGRIKKMSSAQASCILWPRIHMNVVTQSEIIHQKSGRNMIKNVLGLRKMVCQQL
ncbi:hypothetical protein ACQ4PT_017770 [Festuca glaucescens]